MKLRPCGDVLLVEPDEPEPELIVIDLEDGDSVEDKEDLADVLATRRKYWRFGEAAFVKRTETVPDIASRMALTPEEARAKARGAGATAGALSGRKITAEVGII